MTQIVGYIGAMFLICRLLPMLQDQIKKTRPVNLYFLFLEACASTCLGTSAILLNAYPFIIANAFSFLATVFIIGLHVYREYWVKPDSTTIDKETSAIEMSGI